MTIIQKDQIWKHHAKVKGWTTIVIGVIILFAVLVISFFVIAQHPINHARSQAISVAAQKRGLHQINHFYFSNLNQTYYTVKGSKNGKRYYVIMNKHYHPVKTLNINSGVDRAYAINQAKSHHQIKKILNVAPSMFNGSAVWVVSYENQRGNLCYHTFRFTNGHSVQLINNL